MTKTLPPIQDDLVVMSDCHLVNPYSNRHKLFIEVLDAIDCSQVKYLVLTGDIFDFCLGTTKYFHKKFELIGKKLTGIAQQGTQVLYIQGNHEFFVDYLPWEGVQLITDRSISIQLGDHRIAIMHGDRLSPPWHYHVYLTLIR